MRWLRVHTHPAMKEVKGRTRWFLCFFLHWINQLSLLASRAENVRGFARSAGFLPIQQRDAAIYWAARRRGGRRTGEKGPARFPRSSAKDRRSAKLRSALLSAMVLQLHS